ncbi:MAG: glycosyltransferase [Candidatus Omnitrophota bacterium]
MKIGIMAAWNTTSGVAMHAEPIGKALRAMGHKVTVFSFDRNDHHGEGITAHDENYVIRCFGTRTHTNLLDPRPFINADFDVLMVEDLGMLPVDKLANIFPILKKKAKIIHVVHENRLTEHSWFYKLDWDKVVYFDHRQDFLKKVYPDAVYIPFPCFPLRRGNKEAARKKLKLPLDKKIICSFEHRGYHSYYRDLPPELKKKAVLLYLITPDYEMLEALTPTSWRIIKKKATLSTKELDSYLFASDVMILHKFQSRFHAVVSSTVFQALGTGCPIFVPQQSDFFHSWKDEVVHYRDSTALNKKLEELLKDENKRKRLTYAADKYVVEHSPEKIAKQFVDLFESILKKK